MRNRQTDFLQIGEQKGYIKLLNEGRRIHYVAPDKKYKFTDPEEEVRARYYVELIEQYQYPENRIGLEVNVPGKAPDVFADIVVFRDNDKKNPFIVVECKKDEISEAEFGQAIQQGFGNCNALRGHYAAVIAGNTRRFFNVKDFESQERDRNVIADIPVGYGEVQRWRYKKDDPDWDLQAVGREDLTRVLEKCHDTLWQGGKLAPTDAFDELSKILFIKIRDEKKPRVKGDPYDFQIKTRETSKSVADRIKALYQEAKIHDPEVFTENIKVDDNPLFSVVNHLQGINLNQTDLDVKGIAFERFLGGNYFKGDMGQYFTPRELVDFIIKMVEPDHEARVLDPACGSGGFLLYAMEHIQREASRYYEEGTPEHKSHWHNFAEKYLFGIEVNDAIARVAKMNMILHDDGHSNVIGNDALIDFAKLYDQNRGFEKESFDVILTNPPFGANIKKEEKLYLDDYELGKKRKSQKTEILFLERCFDFLKWGTGKLAIILPDGILNNSSLQYVRDYIEQHFRILAVVSLPQIAFKHYKAGVKPSILFLKKFSEEEYSLYQASIHRITGENEAIYLPRGTELEEERTKMVDEQGCPAQIAVTERHEPQFRAILDNIEDLNRKLDKGPTPTFLRWRERFVRYTAGHPQEFELYDEKAANEQLKTHQRDLTALVKEYKEQYKAASDSEWEDQIKADYKERIDTVKEALADKNAEDIRQWVRENANHPIFMAMAERIGYDATGRKDPVNDLDAICDEYHKFRGDPDFFG